MKTEMDEDPHHNGVRMAIDPLPQTTLPPVHVFATISLCPEDDSSDAGSPSRNDHNQNSNNQNNEHIDENAMYLSGLARPLMSWAQLTRSMIEADLTSESGKWLLPLSAQTSDIPSIEDGQICRADRPSLGRFLRYGDGYATYLCPTPLPNQRNSNFRVTVPSLLEIERSAPSIFVHLCAPSGPLNEHPPHPSEFVLETLNCYQEYRGMPIVEWKLRLLSLGDFGQINGEMSSLASVLELDLDADENDHGDGAGIGEHVSNGGRGAQQEEKINVLMFTVDDNHPSLICSYCTVPWKDYVKSALRANKVSDDRVVAGLGISNCDIKHTDTTVENINGAIGSSENDKVANTTFDSGKTPAAIGNKANTKKDKEVKRKKYKSKTSSADKYPQASSNNTHDVNISVNSPDGDLNIKQSVEGKGKECKGDSKKKKTPKDPNAPKRNTGAYIWYLKKNRKAIVESNPSAGGKEITRIVARQFKELTSDELSLYEQLAKDDKERYLREMRSYRGPAPDRESVVNPHTAAADGCGHVTYNDESASQENTEGGQGHTKRKFDAMYGIDAQEKERMSVEMSDLAGDCQREDYPNSHSVCGGEQCEPTPSNLEDGTELGVQVRNDDTHPLEFQKLNEMNSIDDIGRDECDEKTHDEKTRDGSGQLDTMGIENGQCFPQVTTLVESVKRPCGDNGYLASERLDNEAEEEGFPSDAQPIDMRIENVEETKQEMTVANHEELDPSPTRRSKRARKIKKDSQFISHLWLQG